MEDKNKKRVKRSSNFTKEEELLLVEEVEKFRNIIECKITDKVNNYQKSQAWIKITSQFNAKGPRQQTRSVDQMKSKYENLKTKARKWASDNKRYLRGTGGVPSQESDWDPVIETILRVINEKTVFGFQNPNDSDASVSDDPSDIIKIENIEVINQDECQEDVPSSSKLDISPMKEVDVKSTQNADFQTNLPNDWSRYTPVNTELRPTRPISDSLQLAQEEYYKTKNILLKEEIRHKKMEEEDRKRLRQREEEEHEIKMKILRCELKLKEKELIMN